MFKQYEKLKIMLEECAKDYRNILQAWDTNVSQNDIYHMILYWIKSYEKIFDTSLKELANDILDRMNSNDETNDIVEDFVYGSKYQLFRSRFQN